MNKVTVYSHLGHNTGETNHDVVEVESDHLEFIR
jgi:hypothetical protein